MSTQLINEIVEKLREKSETDVIKIETVKKSKLSITESKFAGLPYLPKNSQIPVSENGEQLMLLAQINCEELPTNDFYLQKGIIQFWINPIDDLLGADFDNYTNQNDWRIVYYEDIKSDYYSEEELQNIYKTDFEEENFFPVEEEKALEFTLTKSIMGPDVDGFEDIFLEIYNSFNPNEKIENYFDAPEELLDELHEVIDAGGHQLGGYPFFTQWDPREKGEYEVLLFQMDSENKGSNWNILWGDAGVANFFITKEKLENKDFSDVMYSWDCH